MKVEVRQAGPAAGPVLLLQVEHGGAGAAWPFATGLAVGKNLVLTSGAAGCYLEDFRQKQFKVWATHEAGPLKVEVGEIRVHVRYLQLLKAVKDPKNLGDLKELHCFDLALLTVKGELSQTCALGNARGHGEAGGRISFDLPRLHLQQGAEDDGVLQAGRSAAAGFR